MALNIKQWQSVLLIITALLIWVPIPLIPGRDIAGVLAVIVAIWLLIK